MATLIKKPYGLIYSTDGKICYTERSDDTPFPGVKSWAVEEGTTNMVSDITPLDVAVTSTYNNYEYTVVANSTDTSHYIRFSGLTFGGATATVSFFTKKNTITDLRWNLYNTNTATNHLWAELDTFTGTLTGHYGAVRYSIRDAGDEWYVVVSTDSLVAGDSYNLDLVTNTESVTYYIRNLQLEQKTFATSFVDGTRVAGTLKIPLDFPNDFVIHTWSKMTQDINGSRRLWHVYATEGSNANSFFWGQHSSTQWLFRYFNTSGTNDDYSFALINDTSQWNMYTFAWTGSEYLFYVNGTKIYTLTASLYFTPLYIKIASYPLNIVNTVTWGLFADFFVGQYKDTNGNVIWTDDYIKAIYEQHIKLV